MSNHTATLNHLKRIADYLELGPGVWYKMDDKALTFFDGNQELNELAGPTSAHFRSTTAKDMQKKLEKSWDDCLMQREHLGIPILKSLNETEPTSQTSQTSLPKRPSLSASLKTPEKDGRKSASTSASPMLVAAPCITKNYIAPQREPAGKNPVLDQPSCSVVKVVTKNAKAVEDKLPTCSRNKKSASKSNMSKHVNTKEDTTREVWNNVYGNTTALDTYFATKEQLSKSSSTLLKMKYKSACRTLRPMLLKVKDKIVEVEKAETMKQFQQTHRLKLDSTGRHERQLSAIVNLIQRVESVLEIN